MILVNPDAPTEDLIHEQPNTECYINRRSLGNGVLYVAKSRLCWKASGNAEGLSLNYPHIAIHAISHDHSLFNKDHLYLMVDTPLVPEDDEDSDTEEDQKCSQVRFAPEDSASLQSIYDAISMGQVANPPDDLSDDDLGAGEEEDDEGWQMGPTPQVRYATNGHDHMENGFGDTVNGDEEQMEE